MARKIDRAVLRRLHARGLTLVAIAVRLGVSLSAVKENVAALGLRRGKGWKPSGYSAQTSLIHRERHRLRRSLCCN